MEKEQKTGFGIIGIIIVFAVIAVFGGFFGYQYMKLQNIREEAKAPAAEPPVTPSAQIQPQTEEIDTSTWKTYRSEKYGFEVRYPATLYPSGGPDQIFLAEKATSEKEVFDFFDKLVEIRISNTTYRFNAYFNTADNTVVENYGDLKLRSLEIGGFKTVEYGYDEGAKKKEIEEQGDAIERGASTGVIVFPRGIMLNKNGTIVEISTDSYVGDFKEVFNQILSTFKFIK